MLVPHAKPPKRATKPPRFTMQEVMTLQPVTIGRGQALATARELMPAQISRRISFPDLCRYWQPQLSRKSAFASSAVWQGASPSAVI